MSRRTALHLVAMIALGALSFAAFGWLVEWRTSQAVPVPTGTDTSTAGVDTATVLRRGLSAAAGESTEALDRGDRGEAMAAMDAALRLAGVGRHAADGPQQWAFASAYLQVEQARTSVQMGDLGGLGRHMERVVATMEEAGDADGGIAPLGPSEWGRHVGSTVVDADGSMVGELTSIDEEGRRATIRVGAIDLYGMISLGGTTVTIDADRLVYGDPTGPGVHLVVAPVWGTDAAAVAALGPP